MSRENVGKFYQAAAADEGFRIRLNELFTPYQGKEMDETEKAALIEKLVLPVAAEKGLSFTAEELRQYEEEKCKGKANGELDNEELEAVAGGVGVAVGTCVYLGIGVAVGTGFCLILGI